MKRALTLFAASLIMGIAFMTAGGVMIYKGNVNSGDVYNIIKDNLQIGEANVTFEKAEPIDISNIDDSTVDKSVLYSLNEFNTLNIFADYSSVRLVSTSSDEMKISLDFPVQLSKRIFLRTAVKNGTLYVLNEWTDENSRTQDVTLNVEVPDNYKGGYAFNGSNSDFDICDIESSMDICFNLYNSNVSMSKLTAGDFLLELSGTTVNAEKLSSRDSLDISAISSTINFNNLDAIHSKLEVNNSTLSLYNILGGVTADSQFSTLSLDFNSISANSSITAETTELNVSIPHNSPVALHKRESYSSFSDNIKWTDNGQKNENSRYNIDINVKFGIVTLSEKE